MRLKEFIDKNGNTVKIPKASKTSTGNTGNNSSGYYDRLKKLIDYHIAHKDKDVDKIITNDVRNFGLDYIEHHKGQFEGGYFKKVAIRISDTGDWYFTVDLGNTQIVNKVGKGWDKLVYEASFELSLPQLTSDPEYQELLEFVDKNGNKVTLPKKTSTNNSSSAPANKSNKEKFEELIKYIEYYQVPYIKKTETVYVNGSGFKYNIIRKTPGVTEYTITLELTYGTSAWEFTVYRNGYYQDDATGKGWEALLKALRDSEFGTYAIIPKPGSKEYDSLCESATLKEFVDKNGNKVNLPKNSTTVSKSSTNEPRDKFKALTDYMKANAGSKVAKAEVISLDNGGFIYREIRTRANGLQFTLQIEVSWSQFTSNWKYELYIDATFIEEQDGTGLKELIKHMFAYFNTPRPGSREHKELCESTNSSSIADDFKTYENLWD